MPVCPQGSFPWPVRPESGEPGERGAGAAGGLALSGPEGGSQPGPAANVGNKTVRGEGPG